MTKIQRINKVSRQDTGAVEKTLSRCAEKWHDWLEGRGVKYVGFFGHTPKPGGWWYRFHFQIPFTKKSLDFVSGEGWRVK